MGDKSAIEWTDATWNPIVGCSIVSPGCTNCYAMKMAHRLEAMGPKPDGSGNIALQHYENTTKIVKGNPVWTGKLAQAPEHIITAPLRWKKPRRIFVNSMGDLFHEDVPAAWIDKVFAVMALCPQHTFQVLTKRSKRMREYMNDRSPDRSAGRGEAVMALGADQPLELFRWPLPNVWLGVSCEDQARADERIPDLLATPAAVRFASAEPLLRPIDFTDISVDQGSGIEQWNALIAEPHDSPDTKLNWIIAGGESGPGARPMHPDWVRAIRDQCAAAGTAFHFKQWGEWAVTKPEPGGDLGGEMRRDLVRFVQRDREADGHFRKGDVIMKRVGKKRAGRLLDGIEHNRFPP